MITTSPKKNPSEWLFFGLYLYVFVPNPRKSYVRHA